MPHDQLFDIVRSAATIAALFGALFAILYAYRKQRVEEASGHRADAEGLSKRYQDAAEQLGHEAAAVRLAGVYAMARLADEWPEQRQTCVDVLCAYLRMPETDEDSADREVRRTIFQIISAKTRTYGAKGETWHELAFDFQRATFRDVRLFSTFRSKNVQFDDAKFIGDNSIVASFELGATFDRIDVDGYLRIDATSRPSLFFEEIRIKPGSVLTLSIDSEITSYVTWLRVEGRVDISAAPEKQGSSAVSVQHVLIAEVGTLNFAGGLISDKGLDAIRLSVMDLDVLAGGTVTAKNRLVDRGLVSFSGVRLDDSATVSFRDVLELVEDSENGTPIWGLNVNVD